MLFALTPSDEGAVEQSEIEGEKRLLKFTVYAILCKIEQSLHRASSVPLPLHKGGDWQKITHININLSHKFIVGVQIRQFTKAVTN